MTTNTTSLPQSWRAILDGFCRLQRIQFAAPWRPRQSGC